MPKPVKVKRMIRALARISGIFEKSPGILHTDHMSPLFGRKRPAPEPASSGRYILNGKGMDKTDFIERLSWLLDAARLRVSGGYLFKARFNDGGGILGIIPAFSEGERGYHYTISLPGEDSFTFIGGITPEGEVNCLFVSKEILPAHIEVYRAHYLHLAELFASASKESFPLDWITRKLFADYDIFPENILSLREILLFSPKG